MKKSKFICFIFLCLATFMAYGQKKDIKIGLVLSGGGAKGYAHVGVLKALEEAGIKIDYIGGASMGAIVGALYASGYSADQLKEILFELDLNGALFNEVRREDLPFFYKEYGDKYIIGLEFDNLKLKFPKSLSKGQGALNILSQYLSHVHAVDNFENLPIPFIAIATDIETGEQKVFKEGFLPKVVMASGAYPTLFSPVEIDGSYYVDGGVKNNFPAQEVLDMGADYLIGVDLAAGLLTIDEISNATDIIEQIISFGIEEKTQEQRSLIDLPIIPDVKEISVTNFELKDSIMNEGYLAAKKFSPILDSLRSLQGYSHERTPIEIDSIHYISKIEIHGLKKFGGDYALGKLGLQPNQKTSYKTILKGINTLFATRNFSSIESQLLKNNDNTETLVIDVNEDPAQYYLKFGLHYDQLFKSSLLLNFTAKNLASINSTLSFDLIVGDNPRYDLNYFVDNGTRPSFGFNSSYNRFELERFQGITGGEELIYDYDLINFKSQLYTQSTLSERLAIGAGLEFNYLRIFTKNLDFSDPLREIQDNSYWIPYAFIKADNRDNATFPEKGYYLDSKFQYFLASNQEGFVQSSSLRAYAEYNQPILRNLSFQVSSFVGFTLHNKMPLGFNYSLGGYNFHKLVNSINFYGLPFNHVQQENIVGMGSGIQYSFKKKHFIRYNINVAEYDNSLQFKNPFRYTFVGHGLTYGYLSPIGPVQAGLGYSPNHDKVLPYIALGYWF